MHCEHPGSQSAGSGGDSPQVSGLPVLVPSVSSAPMVVVPPSVPLDAGVGPVDPPMVVGIVVAVASVVVELDTVVSVSLAWVVAPVPDISGGGGGFPTQLTLVPTTIVASHRAPTENPPLVGPHRGHGGACCPPPSSCQLLKRIIDGENRAGPRPEARGPRMSLTLD